MRNKIWLSSPHMGGKEIEFVTEAFDSNWVAPLGPNVDGFELDLSEAVGEGVSVAALSSGTAAIHLALILLGIKPGDEVICQSMTFSASANPIAYLNAYPVFIDSERSTWNMDPDLLEEAIIDRKAKGKSVKAIIVVHLYGMPAQMERITAIAEKYNIPLIEDAAEALGSHINGKKCGSFGQVGILSFNGNKIITTSGGGALVSHDKNLVAKARFLATQARDAAPHYEHSEIGYNYRMSNISAGIGRGQMIVLNDRVNQRRANFEFYKQAFAGFDFISFLKEPEGYFSNRWLTTIHLSNNSAVTCEELRVALEKENIESRPLWKPMHLQPVFNNCAFYGNGISEELFTNGLCLPSGSNLTDEDREDILKIINSILK